MADKSRNLLFDDLVARLIAMFNQSLPQQVARSLIQDAWRSICADRDWSFLRKTGHLILPGGMTGASGTFTFASAKVVVNTATQAYLDAIPFNLVASMGLIGPDGRWYQILSWYTSSATLVLSAPYFGTTVTGAFQICCAVIPPPLTRVYVDLANGEPASAGALVPDYTFNGFISIYKTGGTKTKLEFVNKTLSFSPEQRVSTEPAYLYVHPSLAEQSGFYNATGQGLKSDSLMYQVYPTYNGSATLVYDVIYRSTGGEFSDDDSEGVKVLPTIITSEMLLAAAAIRVGLWAATNLAGSNKIQYGQIAASYAAIYQKAYEAACLRDDNLLSKDRFGRNTIEPLAHGGLVVLDNRQVIVT